MLKRQNSTKCHPGSICQIVKLNRRAGYKSLPQTPEGTNFRPDEKEIYTQKNIFQEEAIWNNK